ncbi:MAG: histidinol-phosphatase [Acidimicrobiaceae bacterium]|nr:histidinol-phosphatase [Acidimicrobiaceae bacterium]
MLDYHLHLWPHGKRDKNPTLDQLNDYCELAIKNGVKEIAITEHLFRFAQVNDLMGGFFKQYPDSPVRDIMEQYWADHARADLDVYVEVALAAKAAGLPIVLGMEVDYYPGRMHEVSEFLAGYPFDVLLGSVHWLGAWPFDHVSNPAVMAEWDNFGIENAWSQYTTALEELADSKAVDVLAHPDLIKVAGHFPKVPEEFYDRMAESASKAGISAEVSSAGWRKPVVEPYPAPYLLRKFHEYGVPITTASDAHGLADVAFKAAEIKSYVKSVGYTSLSGFRNRQSYPVDV